MDRRAIFIAASVIVAVHVLLVILLVLPGCNADGSKKPSAPQNSSWNIPEPEQEQEETEADGPAEQNISAVRPSPAVVRQVRQEKLYHPQQYRALRTAGAKQGLKSIPGSPALSKQSAKNVTGILIDLDSRRVLWQHQADKVVPVASLTKLMTLLLAYENTLDPRSGFTLETPVRITREARVVPPSGVAFKPAETSFPLEKLMIASAVRSANDAAYLIAQSMGGGSAENFVRQMNRKAKELGMHDTTFYNPHGLPGKPDRKPDNSSTVKDIARLCEAYIHYPQLREWSGSVTGTFRTKNDLSSHNHLLPGKRTPCKGVCGLKTGFTNNAGFCVAALCKRNGRTLLAVVTGFGARKERDEYVRNLLNWGYTR